MSGNRDDAETTKNAPLRCCCRVCSHRRPYIIFATVVVLSVGVWGIQTAVDVRVRHSTLEQLTRIALGLVNSDEVEEHLPYPSYLVPWESVGGSMEFGAANNDHQPLYSWRFRIWPYLRSWHGAWDQSRAWDDPANRQLSELSGWFAYDHVTTRSDESGATFPEANCLAITGPGTAFGDGTQPPSSLKDIPPDTILVVESRASGIPWPAPGDFDIRTMPQTINAPDGKGISSRAAGGFHVIFADGHVWFLTDRVPFDTLRLFFTIAGASEHDRETVLGPFALYRHP